MGHLTKKMQVAYDRIAQTYAKVNAPMPDVLAESMDQFLMHISETTCILDLACGAGRDVTLLNQRWHRVVGADLSWGMLQQSRLQTSVPLVQTNMLHAGFGDQIFGGVWCSAALLHLPKDRVSDALAEIYRMLLPDGWFYVAMQEGDEEVWESGAYASPVERFFARYSQAAFLQLLKQNNFAIRQTGAQRAGQRCWLHFLCQKV